MIQKGLRVTIPRRDTLCVAVEVQLVLQSPGSLMRTNSTPRGKVLELVEFSVVDLESSDHIAVRSWLGLAFHPQFFQRFCSFIVFFFNQNSYEIEILITLRRELHLAPYGRGFGPGRYRRSCFWV